MTKPPGAMMDQAPNGILLARREGLRDGILGVTPRRFDPADMLRRIAYCRAYNEGAALAGVRRSQ